MIGAFSPIVVAPAPRATLNRDAALPVRVSGKPMLFIPVGIPDGLVVTDQDVAGRFHSERNAA